MGIKALAQVLGIDIPCPDVDGGQVLRLMQSGDFEMVGRYVRSDVTLVAEIHKFFSGFFCP
jgi:hypothetical protein